MGYTRQTPADFLKKAIAVHGEKYDYSKSEYTLSKYKIIIICKLHGEFSQVASNHLWGNGCPKCKSDKLSNLFKTHGMKSHPLYSRWEGMMDRCYNERHKGYKTYGERGVYVSEDFKDPIKFIRYLESLPNYERYVEDKLTVDRIDGSKGYEEGNLRWADKETQSFNKRQRISVCGYTGIKQSKWKTKWLFRVTYLGETTMKWGFLTKEEAVLARNQYIIDNNLPHKIQEII